jgi:peptidoglycan/LPS O-acetylase OafA/YrhL
MWKLDHGGLLALMAASSSGVDVFFVLSAFVLFLPWTDGRPVASACQFWRRRACRILPLYWLLIGLACGLEWVLPRLPVPVAAGGASAGQIGAHLALLHLQFTALGWTSGLRAAALSWTLCVEVVFYLLLPLIARRFAAHPVVGVLGGVAIALAWRAFVLVAAGRAAPGAVDALGVRLAAQPPMFAAHFAFGMGAASFSAELRHAGVASQPRQRQVARLAPIAGLVGLIGVVVVAGHRLLSGAGGEGGRYLESLPVAAMAAVLICALSLGAEGAPRWATNIVARHLGLWSYGLYLIHYPVLLLISGLGLFNADGSLRSFLLLLGSTAVVSVVLAADVYYLIERPVMRWSRAGTWLASPTPVSATVVATAARS